jgi:hypothetical protein
MMSPGRLLILSTVVMVVGTAFPAAAQQQATSLTARAAKPGAVRASAFATILGHAFNSIDGVLPHSRVRVRDVRYGHVVGSTLTTSEGAYSFKGLDPGNYIVELVNENQTALAATNLINVNAGETARTVVKLPFRPAILVDLLGGQGGSSTTGGITGFVPQLKDQLPQATLQGVAAVVPVGPPISER